MSLAALLMTDGSKDACKSLPVESYLSLAVRVILSSFGFRLHTTLESFFGSMGMTAPGK